MSVSSSLGSSCMGRGGIVLTGGSGRAWARMAGKGGAGPNVDAVFLGICGSPVLRMDEYPCCCIRPPPPPPGAPGRRILKAGATPDPSGP